MSESEDGQNTGQDKRAEDKQAVEEVNQWVRDCQAVIHPYPFRDYASARTAYFKPPPSGPSDASFAGEVVVLRRLLTAKGLELARLQKSYEILESQFNALVCRTNEGQGKPRVGGFGASWCSRLLASAASLFRR
jgi:hypothetical protein